MKNIVKKEILTKSIGIYISKINDNIYLLKLLYIYILNYYHLLKDIAFLISFVKDESSTLKNHKLISIFNL